MVPLVTHGGPQTEGRARSMRTGCSAYNGLGTDVVRAADFEDS